MDDRAAIIGLAVKTGLIPHPAKWVDDMIAEAEHDRFAQMFEGI